MSTITLEEAQARLPELIEKLGCGEELVILKDQQAVAKLVAATGQRLVPEPGCCRGMLTIVAEDDEHLKDFAEYMP